jgi:hypothetical protein
LELCDKERSKHPFLTYLEDSLAGFIQFRMKRKSNIQARRTEYKGFVYEEMIIRIKTLKESDWV